MVYNLPAIDLVGVTMKLSTCVRMASVCHRSSSSSHPVRFLFLFVTLLFSLSIVLSTTIKTDPFQLFKRKQVLRPVFFDSGLNQVAFDQLPCAQLRFLRLMKQEHAFISIRLRHNQQLVSPDFFVKLQQNDSHVLQRPKINVQSDCHFTGELLNLDFTHFDTELTGDEQVVINTHNGTVDAMIEIGREDYFLHYDPKSGNHVLFSESIDSTNTTTSRPCSNETGCPNIEGLNNTTASVRSRRSVLNDRSSIRGFHNESATTRYLELILVNDNKQYLDFKRNETALIERNLQIVNFINSYYNFVNIYVVLVGIVIWNEKDEIQISDNSSQVLENFLIYRKDVLLPQHANDNAQLISGMSFASGTVGKALVGPICSYESSGGINSDHVALAALVASTVAHELGHNFGLQHDNSSCQCPESKCIMADSSSRFRPKHWSDCSLRSFDDAFVRGMDVCMLNVPTKVVQSYCGNGILELDEECDCGTLAVCQTQKCCDMSTCKLTTNSTCGTGTCCDFNRCSPRVNTNHVCRTKKSVCDYPEYCDGHGEFCPADVHYGNGIKCELDGSEAFCFDGQCRSHESQCRLLWGPTSKMSNLTCWKQNLDGTMAANCGLKHHPHNQLDTYLKCNSGDIFCGRLHCNHDAEELKYGWKGAANQMQILIQKVVVCSSAIIDLGLDVMDPGLVPNGAKCGDNRMCVNQKCIKVYSQCENNCYGNGVCKSDSTCVCANGFYPPNCKHSLGSRILLAIYIIFLGILPTVGLIAGGLMYYQEQLKTWWIIKKRKAIIKSRVKRDVHQGSFRARSQQRQNRFAVDFKQVEISQPISLQNGVAVTLCTTSASSSSSPLQHSHHYLPNYSHHSNATSATSNVFVSCDNDSEALRMKPIRPAPPPPPRKPNFDSV